MSPRSSLHLPSPAGASAPPAAAPSPLSEYLVAREPGRRERAENWRVAIGLQKVDGLEVSPYLVETARRNVEGEISIEDARRIVGEYYEEKPAGADPAAHEEADRAAANINAILAEPAFRLSPEYYVGLHRRIFAGVFPFAGKLRTVNLTKKEWVLDGETVHYTPFTEIAASLDWDFRNEREYRYPARDKAALVAHFAAFVSGLWQIHPFREGNTRTAAVFASKYLRELRFKNVSNEPFAEHAWFFRNALVRANYEDLAHGIERTTAPLEAFFRNILLGERNELKNRYLHIRAKELGLVAPPASGVNKPDVTNRVGINVGINVGIKLSAQEQRAKDLLVADPTLSAPKLGARLGVTGRQAERIVSSLKTKTGLRRVGSRKTGRWEFPSHPAT